MKGWEQVGRKVGISLASKSHILKPHQLEFLKKAAKVNNRDTRIDWIAKRPSKAQIFMEMLNND